MHVVAFYLIILPTIHVNNVSFQTREIIFALFKTVRIRLGDKLHLLSRLSNFPSVTPELLFRRFP